MRIEAHLADCGKQTVEPAGTQKEEDICCDQDGRDGGLPVAMGVKGESMESQEEEHAVTTAWGGISSSVHVF